MKKVILLAFLLISIPAKAVDGYKLDLDIVVNGKTVSSPKILVEKGALVSVTQEGLENSLTEIGVIANEGEMQGRKGILLNFQIKHKQGVANKSVLHPQILVAEGKEAEFEISDKNGVGSMGLKVVARRVSR